MNHKQRLVISLGAWFVGLMTLVPPWQEVKIVGGLNSPNSQTTSAGYALLLAPPKPEASSKSYRIDWSRRLAEYLAVVALIGAVFVGVGDRANRPPSTATAPITPLFAAKTTDQSPPSAPSSGSSVLWAPLGARQVAAMFVQVPPGVPPTQDRYLTLLGDKWSQIARSASPGELQRFFSRVGALFPSLPDRLTANTVGDALAENPEVLEVLSGQGLLTGMGHAATAELHEALADHGEPDLESILTVLENAERSLD
jgi:hypothetical protein